MSIAEARNPHFEVRMLSNMTEDRALQEQSLDWENEVAERFQRFKAGKANGRLLSEYLDDEEES